MQQRGPFCTLRLQRSELPYQPIENYCPPDYWGLRGVSMTYRSRRNRPNKDIMTSEDEIVFVLDLAGNFKFVNTAAERVSGYSREEVCRMNVSHLVTPELGDVVSRQIREALKCD